MTSMLTSSTNTLNNAQSPPARFPLARCLITKTPQPTGKKLEKGLFVSHVDPNLTMLISTAGPRLMLAIFKGTNILRYMPDYSAPGMATPNIGSAGVKIMLRFPATPGYEDVCQVAFPDERIAATVIDRLTPYTTGKIATAVLSLTTPIASAQRVVQPTPQTATVAQSTSAQRLANSRTGSDQQPATALQPSAGQPESQMPSCKSPSPVDDSNEANQSQGFLETQLTPEEEQQTGPVTSSENIDTTNGIAPAVQTDSIGWEPTPQHGAKKRKIGMDGEPETSKPSTDDSGTKSQSTLTKFVSNLLDLNEGHFGSSESLGVAHPPLDPYEGTPWGMLDRFPSSSKSCSSGSSGVAQVPRANRFISADLYGMNELQLGEMMDEIVTEAGFQSMCQRVARVMGGRRQMESMYQYEMDEEF